VLATGDFEEAIILAVNHSGDSDSTGAIAGNIAGTLYGADAIPNRWLDALELRDEIITIANDLLGLREGTIDLEGDETWDRYPGR
jgi:ADP-ribosylglycohydrolase